MKDINYEQYLQLSPQELLKLQKTRGRALTIVGLVVYKVLCLFGHKPKNFFGICSYFEIGNGWGGMSLGYYFICSKDCPISSMKHEVGHCIQNAAVGGVKMVAYSIASAFRYWWRKIFGASNHYDSWYFEGDATRVGSKYVDAWAEGEKE